MEIGDGNVAVTSTANGEYTRQKFGEAAPKPESYVFMQGQFFPNGTVDPSLDRMTFRELAEGLAPYLARQQYWPAKDPKDADLLLMVHWGVTSPYISFDEARGRSPGAFDLPAAMVPHTPGPADPEGPPENSAQDIRATFFADLGSENDISVVEDNVAAQQDVIAGRMKNSSNIRLLGYGRHLQAMQDRPMTGTTETTLRSDLATERYFVIVCAYDFHSIQNKKPKVLWTLHLNMRSPGHNFPQAVAQMNAAAVNYFGRQTDSVDTILPQTREGKVNIGEIRIVGESK